MALPDIETRRQILSISARLRAKYPSAFAGARLVLPTGEFFPDEIDVSESGIRTLFQRMLTYSPVPSDVPFELAFVEPEQSAEALQKSCSSGACGPSAGGEHTLLPALGENDDAYIVPIDVNLVRNPVRLTTSLVRSVGALTLAYADEQPADLGIWGEITASLSGFGVLLASGSHYLVKGCSGVKLLAGTSLDVEAQCFALALFALTHESKRAARKHLAPTQEENFDEALSFLEGQVELMKKYREAPELLADGVFEFDQPKGLFSRLFRREDTVPLSVAPRKTTRTPEEELRLAEARALVEDALG